MYLSGLRKFALLFLFISFPSLLYCQIGGKNAYEFVAFPANAKVSGIGGTNVSVYDDNVNMFMHNPALLNTNMIDKLSVSYIPFYAGIHAGSATYGINFEKAGNFGFGVQYFDYGNIENTTAGGASNGSFHVREYAIVAGHSRKVDNFTIGMNLKFAGSSMFNQNAFAVMADMGAAFIHPEKALTVGLTVKNVGYALKKYQPRYEVKMPFDAQLGMTYKLEHMPLRFSVTIHHLHQYDIVYKDPGRNTTNLITGDNTNDDKKTGDIIARHFVLGGEFLLSDNINLRVGYNHLRRKEMRLPETRGMAGFSLGGMLRISHFKLEYTRAFYHAVGGKSFLTISSNLDAFYKTEKVETTAHNF